ncbi:MAG TPA: hypothetical protein VFO69_08480 [Allosphingosinicella sp.]|nr:hypothetical protein [Allosphingosinicella sp.]
MAKRIQRKRWIGISLLAPLILAPVATGEARGQTLPDGAFGWMAQLAGNCWTALYPDRATRDTQCYSVQYGRYLRGTIRIESSSSGGDRPPYLGDSVFAWNAETSEMQFYYWSSGGSHGMTVGRVEGATINFPRPPQVGANAPMTRTSWTRLGPDSYRVTTQRLDDGNWVDGMSITYTRVAADPGE